MASTISVSDETKRKIRNLGRAGDSYEDVILRMYEATKQNLLKNYLYDESDSFTIAQAREQLRNA